MGCPILLGFAEKAKEISKTWAATMAAHADYPPDMVRHAMSVRPPFRETLEHRAKAALELLVRHVLKQALERSQMRIDAIWLQDVPADLAYAETLKVLQRIKDRAVAWKVEADLIRDGRFKTEAELEMVFIERVWQITTLADSLIHDMAQENFTAAGTALACGLAASTASTEDWLRAFEILKETQ